MEKKRKIDTRESVTIVTSNSFITACGLEGISLKARKLLYIAISQCKLTDKEFYEYFITISDFSKLMNISSSHVYEEAENMCDELAKGFIKIRKSEKDIKRRKLFSICDNTKNGIIFQLDKDMTDLLLELKGSFSKPLLHDFLKMRSPYSMAIWHLMQREMKSKKPYADTIFNFSLTLSELRQITGTEKTFERLSDFKRYVLDKALREIKENCMIDIEYTHLKDGRIVVGFDFTAKSQFYIAQEDLSLHTQETIKRINEKRKEKNII